jgi:hypothetical protein
LYFIDEENYGNYSEYFGRVRNPAALLLAELGDKRAGPILEKAHADYWVSPEGLILKPRDADDWGGGTWDNVYTKAMDKLGHPYSKDPHP